MPLEFWIDAEASQLPHIRDRVEILCCFGDKEMQAVVVQGFVCADEVVVVVRGFEKGLFEYWSFRSALMPLRTCNKNLLTRPWCLLLPPFRGLACASSLPDCIPYYLLSLSREVANVPFISDSDMEDVAGRPVA